MSFKAFATKVIINIHGFRMDTVRSINELPMFLRRYNLYHQG